MAKLHFKYATMNSGKSIDLIRTVYNYEEKGLKTLIIKPSIDTKGNDYIVSRIGFKRKVDFKVDINDSFMIKLKNRLNDIRAIFIDEAQFLTEKQVDELFLISKVKNIPVICYGLRNDFSMHAFAGSKRLLEIADILEEHKTLCQCGKIARYVGRKLNGEYEISGEKIVIDGSRNYEYVPLCGECYLKEVLKIDFAEINCKLGGKNGKNCDE